MTNHRFDYITLHYIIIVIVIVIIVIIIIIIIIIIIHAQALVPPRPPASPDDPPWCPAALSHLSSRPYMIHIVKFFLARVGMRRDGISDYSSHFFRGIHFGI